MSQDPPPNVPISDPTHPQEVKAVAIDLGEFTPALTSPRVVVLWPWPPLGHEGPPVPRKVTEVTLRGYDLPLQAGRRYRLLLIAEAEAEVDDLTTANT